METPFSRVPISNARLRPRVRNVCGHRHVCVARVSWCAPHLTSPLYFPAAVWYGYIMPRGGTSYGDTNVHNLYL
jgi:hypothetical protein